MDKALSSSEAGGVMQSPPASLTMALIQKHYLPLASRTIYRKMSEGKFPKADIQLGGKIRLWLRETVERWLKEQAEGLVT